MKFNQLKLSQQIQKIQALVKDLEKIEGQEIEVISLLLKFMTSMFEKVEQRLKALELTTKKK